MEQVAVTENGINTARFPKAGHIFTQWVSNYNCIASDDSF